jgi:hypothetical protein
MHVVWLGYASHLPRHLGVIDIILLNYFFILQKKEKDDIDYTTKPNLIDPTNLI